MLNGLEARLGRLTIGDWRKVTDEFRDQHMQRASHAVRGLSPQVAQTVLAQAANEARAIMLGAKELTDAMGTAEGVMTLLTACMRKVDPRVDRAQVEHLYYHEDLNDLNEVLGRVLFPNARPTTAATSAETSAA